MGNMGPNRTWLLNSHLTGVAREKPLDPQQKVEQLLFYREQLSQELSDVNRQLQELTRQG